LPYNLSKLLIEIPFIIVRFMFAGSLFEFIDPSLLGHE
jgi:hypothetical protein